jgi:hypothetical protein
MKLKACVNITNKTVFSGVALCCDEAKKRKSGLFNKAAARSAVASYTTNRPETSISTMNFDMTRFAKSINPSLNVSAHQKNPRSVDFK